MKIAFLNGNFCGKIHKLMCQFENEPILLKCSNKKEIPIRFEAYRDFFLFWNNYFSFSSTFFKRVSKFSKILLLSYVDYLTLLQVPSILTHETTSFMATALPKKSATALVQ